MVVEMYLALKMMMVALVIWSGKEVHVAVGTEHVVEVSGNVGVRKGRAEVQVATVESVELL